MSQPNPDGRLGKVDTKALKLTAIAATMLDGFVPTSWTPLPPLDAGVRVLLDDDDQQLVATAQTQLDRTADIGSSAEAGRIYESMYPHADFVWPRLRAITEVDADYFDTTSPTTVTLADPLPGAPLGDVPIADTSRASSLAQALATLHSAAPEPVSDAGFPVEDPSRSQFLILERLDQAASTGRVPSSLLQHWEEEFEKVALWHFLATPIHGSLDETSVYTDQERVLALAEIGRLRVADPAIDLAAASALIDPAALPTFYEEYRNSRPRADEHVVARAELLAEFAVLDWLLEAVDSGDETAIEDAGELLRSFNEVLFGSTADDTAPAQGPAADSAAGSAGDAVSGKAASRDAQSSRGAQPATAAAGADSPDVEAAITETAAADVFIPGAQPAATGSDDDSEFDSEPGSQVRTEPTRDSDEGDNGEETGRIR